MSLAEGQVRLAISLAGHEALGALITQVRNLRWFCEEPLIVVQLGRARLDAIEEDVMQRRALRLLEGERGVLVNPHAIEAGAGFTLHAHLSNFALLCGRGEAFSHFVTLAPGDLFFRHGAEAALRGLDASAPVAGFDAAEAPMLRDDAPARALLAARGLTRVLSGPLGGQFHARALLEEMARVLGRHFGDKTQEEPSAREEFLLPTLLQEHPSARLGLGLAHVLGAGSDAAAQDRRALALALRELGALQPEGPLALDRWGAAVLEAMPSGAETLLHGRFVLGGLPRLPVHPLRLLIEQAAAHGGAWPARALARRFTPADLRRLDLAALEPSAAPSTGRQELLSPALGRGVHDLDLAPCPGGDHPPLRVAEGLSAGAAHLPAPGARARIILRPGSLLALLASSLAKPEEAAFFFACLDVPPPAAPAGLLRLALAPDSPAPRQVWMEAHGPAGVQRFPLGDGEQADEDAQVRLHPLPPALRALAAAPDGLRFVLCMAQGFGPPGCKITSLGFVAAPG
jgi:hypothetical protein